MPKFRLAIFVHGCFWHYHEDCNEGRIPDTNSKFWKNKLSKNVERDKKHRKALKEDNWTVMVVWECEVEKKLEGVLSRINEITSN